MEFQISNIAFHKQYSNIAFHKQNNLGVLTLEELVIIQKGQINLTPVQVTLLWPQITQHTILGSSNLQNLATRHQRRRPVLVVVESGCPINFTMLTFDHNALRSYNSLAAPQLALVDSRLWPNPTRAVQPNVRIYQTNLYPRSSSQRLPN